MFFTAACDWQGEQHIPQCPSRQEVRMVAEIERDLFLLFLLSFGFEVFLAQDSHEVFVHVVGLLW